MVILEGVGVVKQVGEKWVSHRGRKKVPQGAGRVEWPTDQLVLFAYIVSYAQYISAYLLHNSELIWQCASGPNKVRGL